MRSLVALSLVMFAASAQAQITQASGTPPGATVNLDFDNPFVASGAIAGTSTVFTTNGIASVALFGSWSTTTDTITAGSNGSGQSLVSRLGGTGTMSVAGVGELLDSPLAGAGFDINLQAPASAFGVLFIDQINFSYQVELLSGAASLGVGAFSYSGSFPQPAHYWSAPSSFDRIRIIFPSGTGGVGIDNLTYVPAGAPPIVTYCTAGTSTNGCLPAISANNQPSVSLASSCVLSVANVEGQKSGLIFYGIDNTGFTPVAWGPGSPSFLCVKPPTQRMVTQSSGGTNGLCDGTLTQDFNAFLGAFPASLGQPFVAGDKVFAQAWYRDPQAVKTTNLSDAVELTFVP